MTAVPDKEGRFKLSNVEILKQENGGTSTELDADAVAAYKIKYAMKYQTKHMKYVWWHSHHTMGAFWSGTDENEIDAWKNSSFSLALVVNLREEYVFRVSIWNANGIPLEQHIDTSLEIIRGAKPVVTAKMKTLYKNLCEKSTSNVITYGGYGYNRHRGITNGYQTNLLAKNSLDLPNFRRMHKNVDSLTEDFMQDTLKFKEFKKEMKLLRNECVKEKYDFKVKAIYCGKQEAMNDLMYLNADDMFDFDDNDKKLQYQQDNDWYGGWVS